jgi:hypothetical protein
MHSGKVILRVVYLYATGQRIYHLFCLQMAVDKYILAMFLLEFLLRLPLYRCRDYRRIPHRSKALAGYSTHIDGRPYPHCAVVLAIDSVVGSWGYSKCRSKMPLGRMLPLPRDVLFSK